MFYRVVHHAHFPTKQAHTYFGFCFLCKHRDRLKQHSQQMIMAKYKIVDAIP